MTDFKKYSELYHFGTKGMKWGVRRYQNPDGTLTEAGKKRYFDSTGQLTRAGKKELKRRYNVRGSSIAKGITGAGVAAMLSGYASAAKETSKRASNLQNHYLEQWANEYVKDNASKNPSSLFKDPTGYKTKLYKEAIEKYKNNPSLERLGKRASKHKKLATAALVGAGAVATITAFTVYKNEKNKKRMREQGKEYIDFMYSGKLKSNKTDSSVTKQVKKDYNRLSDQGFMNKYYGSKKEYADNVFKYDGDPYMNSPAAKRAKRKQKRHKKKRR